MELKKWSIVKLFLLHFIILFKNYRKDQKVLFLIKFEIDINICYDIWFVLKCIHYSECFHSHILFLLLCY